MATAQDALRVAAGEIGYSRWNDPEQGTKYGRWYAEQTGEPYFGYNGVPFCAMFTSWVLAQVGVTPPGGLFAYVPSGINAARARGRLVSVGDARPGDMLAYDWDRDGVADHIGFLETVLPSGALQTVEGNTSNGRVARRVRDRSTVCAVIRPDYDGTSTDGGSSGRVAVDGWIGPDSTRALQEICGTPVDGYISGQDPVNKPFVKRVTVIRWEYGGSTLVRALQSRTGANVDGYLGPDTVRHIQRLVGAGVDGYLGPETATALQRWINNQ